MYIRAIFCDATMATYKFDEDANIIGLIPNPSLLYYKKTTSRNINFFYPSTIVDFLNAKIHYDYHNTNINKKIITCGIDARIETLVKRKYNDKWESYFDIYENYPEFEFMRPFLLNTAKVNITSNVKNLQFNKLIETLNCSTKNVEIKTANHIKVYKSELEPHIKTLEIIQLPTSPLFMGIFYNRTQTIDQGIKIQHRIIYPVFINTSDLNEADFTTEKLITIEINKDIIISHNKENGNIICEVNNFDYYDLKFIINLIIYLKNFFL